MQAWPRALTGVSDMRAVKDAIRRLGASTAFGSLTVVLVASPAAAGLGDLEPPEEPWEQLTPEILNASVFSSDPERSVLELGEADQETEEDVVVLQTDILFSPNEWDLPGSAASRIGELVEEIPDGAAVRGHGHTDSRAVPEVDDFDDQELSEVRTQAVADVLEEQRADLHLEVEGFGDSQPAEAEEDEDPSSFAANRRVEIRHG